MAFTVREGPGSVSCLPKGGDCKLSEFVKELVRVSLMVSPFYFLSLVVSSKSYLRMFAGQRAKFQYKISGKEKFKWRLDNLTEYVDSIHWKVKGGMFAVAVLLHILAAIRQWPFNEV